MILLAVVIAVIVLAFAVPGLVVSLRDRSQSRPRPAPQEPGPAWWPQFERDFRDYVRRLEHERRRRDLRQLRRPHAD